MSDSARGPVVIVGGRASWPGLYRQMSRFLENVSGAPVSVVPITPLDWALAGLRGYGQIVFEVARAVDEALLQSETKQAAIVGHAEGGILARIYLGGDPPFGGRRYSGHRRVSRLFTLGTPHNVPAREGPFPLAAQTNDLFPGTLHSASGLRYVCVAGDVADGADSGAVERRYRRFGGDGRVKGDGVVPVSSALLPDATHVVLSGVGHSRFHAGAEDRWYGSDRETVERWWLAGSEQGLPQVHDREKNRS